MNDCSKCKYCDIDYIFDEDSGEEYPLYTCKKGNDTRRHYECSRLDCLKRKVLCLDDNK